VSWLKNHLRHFVLPGIHTLARFQGRNKAEWGAFSSGGLTAADIKPRDKQIRPSTKCKFVEAGMLYSLVSSVLRKGNPTREIALGLCRQIGRAKDAEFVYAIDTRGGVKKLGAKYDGVEGSDVLHSMLCNSMRRLKRKMRRKGSLLLPGRDVWCWEVLARKLSVASTFDSRVSRSVAYNNKALRSCIDDWKIKTWDDVLFFDTGFSGTIPKAIARAEKLEGINMLLLSSGDHSKQIFRTHTGSREKALAFEYLAKYFVSGTHRDGVPYQELATLDEFINASLLTIWLWYHVSPTRLPSYRDKKILGYDPKMLAKYTTINVNPSNLSSVSLIGSDLVNVQPMTLTTGSSAATTSNWTADWTIDATTAATSDTTIDALWGTGATQQLLIDGMQPPSPALKAPLTIGQEMQQEMDKAIIKGLLKDAGGNPDKIPPGKIPVSLLFEPIPLLPQTDTIQPVLPASKKLKPYVLNPATFELCDAKTGLSVEAQMDAKALAVYKGKEDPTEEGFSIGQYPGPPVVSGQKLKLLAGADPYGPIPDIDLSFEIGPLKDGVSKVFKKTTLTTSEGKKTIYKTPITG